jgi:hypothetical protein
MSHSTVRASFVAVLAGAILAAAPVARAQSPSEKAWDFSSPPHGSGSYYVGGFYRFADRPADFASPTMFGAMNNAYAAHVLLVTGSAASGATTITVTGTSIDDSGTAREQDTETLVVPAMAAPNFYLETDKKWLGRVRLQVTSGSPIPCNYGFAKYWDNNNTNFAVLGLEATWRAGADDVSPDIRLHHHGASGWTFNPDGAPTPPAPVASMRDDHGAHGGAVAGENGAWKRANLSVPIAGAGSEGTIIEVVTTTNGTFASGTLLMRIAPR